MTKRDEILNSFEEGKPPKLRVLCRLWVKGRFVQTRSRKTVWTSVSNIKNAIHLHIDCFYDRGYYNGEQKEFVASIPIVEEGNHQNYDIAIVKLKENR